jgi:hypothetical protein
MRSQHYAGLLATAALLSACASGSRWHLNGRTEAQFLARDQYCTQWAQAQVQANPEAPGTLGYGLGSRNNYMAAGAFTMLLGELISGDMYHDACMKEAGFIKAK